VKKKGGERPPRGCSSSREWEERRNTHPFATTWIRKKKHPFQHGSERVYTQASKQTEQHTTCKCEVMILFCGLLLREHMHEERGHSLISSQKPVAGLPSFFEE
jgi:hypothetical protein